MFDLNIDFLLSRHFDNSEKTKKKSFFLRVKQGKSNAIMSLHLDLRDLQRETLIEVVSVCVCMCVCVYVRA